jgi:hypothetical protein
MIDIFVRQTYFTGLICALGILEYLPAPRAQIAKCDLSLGDLLHWSSNNHCLRPASGSGALALRVAFRVHAS